MRKRLKNISKDIDKQVTLKLDDQLFHSAWITLILSQRNPDVIKLKTTLNTQLVFNLIDDIEMILQ